MEMDVERSADHLCGQRIGKCHGPRSVSGAAITAAGGEAAQSTKGMTESNSRRKHIYSLQHRHARRAHVPDARNQRGQQSSVEHAASLQQLQAEEAPGILRV